MTKYSTAATITLSSLIIGSAPTGLAQPTDLMRISRAQVSDGAWSRGVHGTTMSAAVESITLAGNSESNVLTESSTFTWQKFEITKGLVWPYDINLAFAYNSENMIYRWSGNVQYSFFQRPMFPALAVRAGYSNLSNLEDLDSDNYSGALTASWGYKKVIAFGSLQLNLSSMSGYEEAENDVYFSSTQNIGFQYNITPLSKISYSQSWDEGTKFSDEVRLSVGL